MRRFTLQIVKMWQTNTKRNKNVFIYFHITKKSGIRPLLVLVNDVSKHHFIILSSSTWQFFFLQVSQRVMPRQRLQPQGSQLKSNGNQDTAGALHPPHQPLPQYFYLGKDTFPWRPAIDFPSEIVAFKRWSLYAKEIQRVGIWCDSL